MPILQPMFYRTEQLDGGKRILLLILLLFGSWSNAGSPGQGETVLVFRPETDSFLEAKEGLVDGLEEDFVIEELHIKRGETTVVELTEKIKQTKPDLIVLMGIGSINLYKKFQQGQLEGTVFPPGLILMSLYAERPIRQLKNVTGISYEIPGVNSLNQLRLLVQAPIHKVGVLYSPELEGFFQDQKKLCLAERIELVGLSVSPKKKKKRLRVKDIKISLQTLVQTHAVDALWVLNDTTLLGKKKGSANSQIIKKGWAPTLERLGVPVLVSVKNLMLIGHLGVFPDHYGLGEQAASMIYKIRDNRWQLDDERIQHPISVTKTVNMLLVKAAEIKLNDEVLAEMDEILSASNETTQ